MESTRLLTSEGFTRWTTLFAAQRYIGNPDQWKKPKRSMLESYMLNRDKRIHDLNARNGKKEIINYSIFGIEVLGRTRHALGKWIRRKIPMASLPTAFPSTAVKDAILSSLRNSGGQLPKGETALKSYGMLGHLNWVCQPSGSTTETILIWHVATTLFHHQNRPSPQQSNDPFKEKREVALALSNYCIHLLAHLPELLPEEVEWAQQMYESVEEEIYAIDDNSNQKPTATNRCNYAISEGVEGDEKSVVGKGAKLAKLLDYIDKGAQEWKVWTMLSEFWAEMMLFIAPSDNVEGHKKRLGKGELITQVWALLTHAGILTRPQRTEHCNHGIKSNEATEGGNV